MSIEGIEEVIYGVEDLAKAERFWTDWGLRLAASSASELDFRTLNGSAVRVRAATDASLPPAIEPGSTVREVTWCVDSAADLDVLARHPGVTRRDTPAGSECVATDPNGLAIRFRVSTKQAVDVSGSASNNWGSPHRINEPSRIYERAEPIEIGHVVFFTDKLQACEDFYVALGFVVSDRYPGRAIFLRASPTGGHHDLFLLQVPGGKPGLNHVAFSVRDIHEVFGGGLHISRCGWETQLGPGRHPISSAYFWYVKTPCGGLAEYNADEDMLTSEWTPRDFTPSNEAFAEWAIEGGLDGNTRRQRAPGGDAIAAGKFGTERRN
jgi:catechol 2,3-dioxygenase-like lactoylglutathione lyase family enzyme